MSAIEAYFYIVSLLLGSVVGSFLNVAIYRLPRRESVVNPPSHCPECGARIRWYDNVPVVSWLVLRGKCRDCGCAISARYPVVEGLTGITFALTFARMGLSWHLLVAWAFLAALIVIAFIDRDHMIIPDKIVLPGAVAGLALSCALNPGGWWEYLAGSVGAAVFLLLLALLWPGGMGAGDVKMGLFMGAILGRYVIVAMFLAFLAGGIVGMILLLTKRKSRKDALPFGPFLAAGAALALLAGEITLDSYLTLY